jgi:hypothetical protein
VEPGPVHEGARGVLLKVGDPAAPRV